MIVWIDETTFKRDTEENPEGVFVLQFGTDWCKNCELVSPLIEELAEKYKDEADLKIGFVDADGELEFVEEQNIASIPTTAIYVGDKVVERIVGAHPIKTYEDAIRKHYFKEGNEIERNRIAEPEPIDFD